VPGTRDTVALDQKLYMVVNNPTHYFEWPHEVAFIVQPVELVEMEPEPEPELEPAVAEGGVPLNAAGDCAYCDDPDCPGGEECNFYDGSLG
jgi:hypothetical protein